ncbi:hypothetical protein [Lichenicoccus sp.]|uniref:hypothetical protein n=1 Tax=Lichenicoccus sp. TaxID=2781899 RepID=UPI003D0EA205
MTLPLLTAAATEEQLRAHLTRNWKTREPVQAALVQAYTAAKSQRFAPIAALDAYYRSLERSIWDTRRQNAGAGFKNAEDWNCELRVLRLSLAGLEYYTAFSARWEKMSDAQRVAEQLQAQKDEEHKALLRNMNHVAALTPSPVFSPTAFLQQLEASGIRVAAIKHDLVVHNAAKLTDHQRHLLKTQKAGILQALGSTETF